MKKLVKKNRILVGIGVMVLALLIVSQAIAWGPQGMGMNPGKGWIANLKLTQKQTQKINILRQKFMHDTLAMRSKLASARVELRTLFTQTGVDNTQLKTKHNEILNLQKALQAKWFEFRLAVRKLLTPEQLAQASLGWGPGMGRHYGRMGYCRRMTLQ